jgi:hypothetical protein
LKSSICTLQLFIPLFGNIADMSCIGTQAKRLLLLSLYFVIDLDLLQYKTASCMDYDCYNIHNNDTMLLLNSIVGLPTASSCTLLVAMLLLHRESALVLCFLSGTPVSRC